VIPFSPHAIKYEHDIYTETHMYVISINSILLLRM